MHLKVAQFDLDPREVAAVEDPVQVRATGNMATWVLLVHLRGGQILTCRYEVGLTSHGGSRTPYGALRDQHLLRSYLRGGEAELQRVLEVGDLNVDRDPLNITDSKDGDRAQYLHELFIRALYEAGESAQETISRRLAWAAVVAVADEQRALYEKYAKKAPK